MADSHLSIEELLSKKAKTQLKGGAAPAAGAAPTSDEDESTGGKLEKKLENIQISGAEAKVKSDADALGLPYLDLTAFPMSEEALKTIPENVCRENNLICFVNTGEEFRLASTDPKNPKIEEIKHSLEDSLHSKGALYLISKRSLEKALKQYARLPKLKAAPKGVEVSAEEMEKFKSIVTNFKQLDEYIKKVNVTELVTLIIAAAVQANSSDIHIEAEENDVKVRFRVDGILHDAASIDKALWPKIISRIKLLSGLKLNITEKPQDGRFSIKMTEGKMDVRVSCTPITWGESVVMRLLKASSTSLTFEDLGIIGKAYAELKTQTERPNGMIITTGPTGSGKTTTLYAILNKLNTEGIKIFTLEDPVEYKLEGINQSQIDHSKGYSFADGLRSILRQDPDIVMVGEMRDLETAETAINSALTGHLVLSTIHTNSAAGAIPRFLALGVKPFLLAPALNIVMGQRLVRKICQECKQEVQLDPEKLKRATELLSAIPEKHPDRPDLSKLVFYESKGCKTCNDIGYKGRLGIYEIMILSPEIEKLISVENVSENDIQNEAIKGGMITMAQDGLLKALKGITSVDEIFRVSE
ncbi:GspE/PulE family protein [Patescibacteria group bacterium]|nr:GspE/PulE family protein [Patescibacteria group bacterium]